MSTQLSELMDMLKESELRAGTYAILLGMMHGSILSILCRPEEDSRELLVQLSEKLEKEIENLFYKKKEKESRIYEKMELKNDCF